jgi:hypothetical protein
MPGLQGYGLTTTVDSEIVAAYAASQDTVPAVDTDPGWVTVGAFTLPKSLAACRLEAIACVSDASLSGVVRLWDATAGAEQEVSGSRAAFTSVGLDETVHSATVALAAGRFLVQAQVTGDSGDYFFGLVRTASLVGP